MCPQTMPPQIWDLRSDALLQHYRAHTGAITGAAFHPSGSFLLTSSLDTTLKVRGRGCPWRETAAMQLHSYFHT